MSSTYGENLKLSIFGQSHGAAIGMTLDGIPAGLSVDFEKLHAEIVMRDKQDSEREFSPLICAKDAIVIDTSNMNIEDVVAVIKKTIQTQI